MSRTPPSTDKFDPYTQGANQSTRSNLTSAKDKMKHTKSGKKTLRHTRARRVRGRRSHERRGLQSPRPIAAKPRWCIHSRRISTALAWRRSAGLIGRPAFRAPRPRFR